MMRLSTLLLAPAVAERLSERYSDYRQHGVAGLPVGVAGLGADAAGNTALAGDSEQPS